MSDSRDDGGFRFLVGLLFGFLGGFVAGILNAERPGREIRREIELNSSDFIEGLRDRFDDIKDQASDTIRDFKGFTDEKLKKSAINIQEQVDSLGKQLEELTKKQAASISSERN